MDRFTDVKVVNVYICIYLQIYSTNIEVQIYIYIHFLFTVLQICFPWQSQPFIAQSSQILILSNHTPHSPKYPSKSVETASEPSKRMEFNGFSLSLTFEFSEFQAQDYETCDLKVWT